MSPSEAQIEQSGDKVREARLRWFGHAQRRAGGYSGAVRQDEKRKTTDL